jgi:hypothetical protein
MSEGTGWRKIGELLDDALGPLNEADLSLRSLQLVARGLGDPSEVTAALTEVQRIQHDVAMLRNRVDAADEAAAS